MRWSEEQYNLHQRGKTIDGGEQLRKEIMRLGNLCGWLVFH